MTQIPKIILDTDPGGDDTFAFLWLLSLVKQGYAELVAVTSTDGNVSAPKTFTNANQILNLVEVDSVEVGRGVLLKQPAEDASHIHGSDGMGNLSSSLPPPKQDYQTARFSDEILIEYLNANPGEITLIAIGPLTNLAAAELKRPGILRQAKEVVIMGGAFLHRGNVTPQAEFNIWFNPDAAATVFNSRNDLVIVPLDVTAQLIFTQEMVQSVSPSLDSKMAVFLHSLWQFMTESTLSYRETAGIPGFLVHDAATLAYLFYPELFRLQRAKVHIETHGEWTRGQTVIDRRSGPKLSANAWIAVQVDATQFFANLIEDFKFLLKNS